MELVDIKNIIHEETAIYYRQKYHAIACFNSIPTGLFEVPIFFVIEIDPLSQKKIIIELQQNPDYPLIPLIRALRARILTMHNDGTLF